MTGIRQASGPNLVLERSRELYALGRRESQAGGRWQADGGWRMADGRADAD